MAISPEPFIIAALFLLLAGAVYTLRSNTAVRPVLNKDSLQEFKLKEKTVLSHNTAIYRFALPRPNDVLGLPIGQHISISLPVEGKANPVLRSYTPISSDEEDKGYFDLLIKAYPQGIVSKHVSNLKLGETIQIKGPKGQMNYTPNMVRAFGMIAGGTGLTPMLQIIRAIIRGRPRNGGKDVTEVDFIFANVTEQDILLKDQLDKLAAEDDGFRVHYVLDKPPAGWTGGSGFITADMIKEKLPAPASDIKILACGPLPMVNAIKKATESLGYEKAQAVSKIHDQVFSF